MFLDINVLFLLLRELFELMSTPKGQQRTDAPDTQKLMELLVLKDKEIKETLKSGN